MKILRRTAIVLASLLAALTLALVAALGYQAVAATPDDPRADAPRYGGRGPHAVGTRQAWTAEADGVDPLRLVVWYPATYGVDATATVAYRYETTWLVRTRGPILTRGRATRDAPAAEAGRGLPLVVLSSGFALPAAGYVWLAERLASYGFVVIAPEHPEWMDLALDGFWRGVIDRPAQLRAVLAWAERQAAPAGELAGILDPRRVAVVGHSLGGTAALALAGARLDLDGFARLCGDDAWRTAEPAFLCDLVLRDVHAMAARAGLPAPPSGLWPTVADARVDAVVAMASDGFLFGPQGLAGVDVPLLAIGGTADASAPFAWSSGWAFAHAQSRRKVRVGLEGAGHMVFTASCGAVPLYRAIGAGGFCSDAAWSMDRAHDRIAHLVTAFLRAELAGDGEAARALSPSLASGDGIEVAAQGYGEVTAGSGTSHPGVGRPAYRR